MASQPWLIPYENPLPKKFAAEFFKSIPRTPGVYIMTGVRGDILYIGKAKDLRARLNSYKRAKPDQVSRKVIRLVNRIAAIRWEECASEEASLLRENSLLREHRPPFNVVNTSPESYYFIAIRSSASFLELRLTTNPDAEEGEELFGTYKGRGKVREGYAALLRLLWASHAVAPERFEFPSQLVRHKVAYKYSLKLGERYSIQERARWFSLLRRFLNGTSKSFLASLTDGLLENPAIPPFYYHMIQGDLETLIEFFQAGPHRNCRIRRAHGLTVKLIAQDEIDDLLVTFKSRRQSKPA